MLALCRDLKAAQNYAGIIFTSLPANTVLFLEFSSAELRGLLDNYVACTAWASSLQAAYKL